MGVERFPNILFETPDMYRIAVLNTQIKNHPTRAGKIY